MAEVNRKVFINPNIDFPGREQRGFRERTCFYLSPKKESEFCEVARKTLKIAGKKMNFKVDPSIDGIVVPLSLEKVLRYEYPRADRVTDTEVYLSGFKRYDVEVEYIGQNAKLPVLVNPSKPDTMCRVGLNYWCLLKEEYPSPIDFAEANIPRNQWPQ